MTIVDQVAQRLIWRLTSWMKNLVMFSQTFACWRYRVPLMLSAIATLKETRRGSQKAWKRSWIRSTLWTLRHLQQSQRLCCMECRFTVSWHQLQFDVGILTPFFLLDRQFYVYSLRLIKPKLYLFSLEFHFTYPSSGLELTNMADFVQSLLQMKVGQVEVNFINSTKIQCF